MKEQNLLKSELTYTKAKLSLKKLTKSEVEKARELFKAFMDYVENCKGMENQDPRTIHNSCSLEAEWVLDSLIPEHIKYVTIDDIAYLYREEMQKIGITALQAVKILRKFNIIEESTTIRHNNRTIRASKVLKHAKMPNAGLF